MVFVSQHGQGLRKSVIGLHIITMRVPASTFARLSKISWLVSELLESIPKVSNQSFAVSKWSKLLNA